MPSPCEALIVAHGQPWAPEPPEEKLAVLAADVQARLRGWTVRSATIAMPGRLEDQAALMPKNGVIYPFFMSDGWFVSRVLPKRLGNAPQRILPPFGFDDALPQLAADLVSRELAQHGWRVAETTVVLAAHGSARGPRAAEATHRFASLLKSLIPNAKVRTGFVEECPCVEAAAFGADRQSICLPFFAQEGDHCRDDIPRMLDQAGFEGVRLKPLGEAPDVASLIADTLTKSGLR
ncbi:sirohydrochlorin chelatase [Shimia abyssi]|uniref:Sirohydrochlorin ferrochelatase n=1 Tax=Shimia abyssi TaxID=1662395 RepID=A0A2P8FEK3_9RHOB|nr:CbiX/SirB N-terminal domain-containing protein [Shimia abyssi]PSL20147.1 sirohydrochlorin ferrochelatase [Shimia abyssi]